MMLKEFYDPADLCVGQRARIDIVFRRDQTTLHLQMGGTVEPDILVRAGKSYPGIVLDPVDPADQERFLQFFPLDPSWRDELENLLDLGFWREFLSCSVNEAATRSDSDMELFDYADLPEQQQILMSWGLKIS